jgi:hypothetical protein
VIFWLLLLFSIRQRTAPKWPSRSINNLLRLSNLLRRCVLFFPGFSFLI